MGKIIKTRDVACANKLCGTGNVLAHMAKNLKSIIGVDNVIAPTPIRQELLILR